MTNDRADLIGSFIAGALSLLATVVIIWLCVKQYQLNIEVRRAADDARQWNVEHGIR